MGNKLPAGIDLSPPNFQAGPGTIRILPAKAAPNPHSLTYTRFPRGTTSPPSRPTPLLFPLVLMFLTAAALGPGCSNETNLPPTATVCRAGSERQCTCENPPHPGVQVCNPDALGWGECLCVEIPDTGLPATDTHTPPEADAHQMSCPDDLVWCDGQCSDLETDSYNCGECGLECPRGEMCTGGRCRSSCPGDLIQCGSQCVNTDTSPDHCGTCDHRCPAGLLCSEGSCVSKCMEGLTECFGGCVNIQTDQANCGECGHQCGDNMICWGAACVVACGDNFTECSGTCVDIQSDPQHCGECDHQCSPGQVCEDSDCRVTCSGHLTNCNGACIDLNQDNTNCGICGYTCSEGLQCMEGKCRLVCPIGTSLCGQACVNLFNDRNNCGRCKHKCQPGYQCVQGECILICPPGQTPCNGQCANLGEDNLNCGECGNPCAPGSYCQQHRCVPYCPPGLLPCDDQCVDITSDRNHCGKCDHNCGLDANKDPRICRQGFCVTPVVGLIISRHTLPLHGGESATIYTTVLPTDATVSQIIWTSSQPAVATVNSTGTVTGVDEGTTIITAATVDGNYRATCVVTVTIPVGFVALSPAHLSLAPGSTHRLTPTVTPANATHKQLLWTSSNMDAVTVNQTGMVTASTTNTGTATITATAADRGLINASTSVTVTATPVTGITLHPEHLQLNPGEGAQLTAQVLPPEAFVKDLVWYSRNPETATVDSNGYVTTKKDGTTVIQAITLEGNFVATCTLHVVTRVTGISLSPAANHTTVGDLVHLYPTINPANATNPLISWSTSDSSVAVVDQSGLVTSLSPGTAVITVTTLDGGFTASSIFEVIYYHFTSHYFTNCNQNGRTGPTPAQCRAVYSDTTWANDPEIFWVDNGVQIWSVPDKGTYRIEAWGARGGLSGGMGAYIAGNFELPFNTKLKILVGQMGLPPQMAGGAGGGGGTFVTLEDNTPLLVAGGGGGKGSHAGAGTINASLTITGNNGYGGGAGGTNGNGGGGSHAAAGGGLLTAGANSLYYHALVGGGGAFSSGAVGGVCYQTIYSGDGGFGGGGGAFGQYAQAYYGAGGGGGGYSGGGGGYNMYEGGGGGSFNSGKDQLNQADSGSSHGMVLITRLD